MLSSSILDEQTGNSASIRADRVHSDPDRQPSAGVESAGHHSRQRNSKGNPAVPGGGVRGGNIRASTPHRERAAARQERCCFHSV